MSALEAMVRAYHAEKFGPHAEGVWNQCPPAARTKAFECMRAALRALADAELSDAVISAGWIDKEDVTPDEILSAMAREISKS